MSRRSTAQRKILAAWEPPAGAGEPVGVVASTFTFDADFFEEELLARFFCLESSIAESRVYCAERETRLGDAVATVLVDRRHANRTNTFAWDVLPVPVPFGCCQHSKVTVLAWQKAIRVVVASANLTEGSYRRNLEVFAALDFAEGGDVPRTALTPVLDFLERLVRRVPSPSQAHGPVQRALGLIGSIRRLGDSLTLAQDWTPKAVRVFPVFLEHEGAGVLDRMSELWGNGPQPQTVALCAPFWAAATNGKNPVVDALSDRMAVRGDRNLQVFVPGEPDVGGTWIVQAPRDAFEGVDGAARRLKVEVHAVPAAQGKEHRQLHGKLQRWSRDSGPDMLLVGSSNATEAGLGIGGSPRNIEANLCFISDRERSTLMSFNATFPEAERVSGKLKYLEREECEEGEQCLPVSDFFSWAEYTRADAGGKLVVGFNLGASEPDGWSLSLPAGQTVLDWRSFHDLGRPSEFALELSGKQVPFVVKVRWLHDGQPQQSDLPVNASDEGTRCDPGVDVDLDLDTLLDTLGSRLPLWRRLVEVLRRPKQPLERNSSAELDPHRRVDTSAFLMQRMRRISRALEGLRERLASPVPTPSSLEWRFRGPLGPMNVAKILAGSLGGASDVAFVLAELSLTVARASQTVRADGVDVSIVKQRFRLAVEEVAQMSPPIRGDAALESYMARALARARTIVERSSGNEAGIETSTEVGA